MNKIFTEKAFDQYVYWSEHHEEILQKINRLLQSIERDGVDRGLGDPKPFTNELAGHWSRKIDEYNQLIYKVDGRGRLHIISCRG